jgi:hypothetical protein
MSITHTSNRTKATVWWISITFIGLLTAYFTYNIGLSPVDVPNGEIFPFLPGIFIFAASHGFRESSLPNRGPIAFLIAAFNACFYMALVFLFYRWTRRSQRKPKPHE